MKHTILRILLLGLLVAGGSAPASARFEIDEVDASVVRIEIVVRLPDGKLSLAGHGSGFVVADELVMTNSHVAVPDYQALRAQRRQFYGLVVPDGGYKAENLRRAALVKAWPEYDLALIRVPGLDRPAAVLSVLPGDTAPERGEAVHAVGFPGAADVSGGRDEALKSTLTSGLVGRVVFGRGGNDQKDRPIIQHNAAISGGNSGGPLYNDCHEVVGVNTFGPRSIMEVLRDRGGNPVLASGSAVSGIYFSPHVGTVVEVLRAQNVDFKSSDVRCVATASGQSTMMYIYLTAALLIAGAALVLALRRPRQQIVQVVETYSQMLRRKGAAAPRRESAPQPEAAVSKPAARSRVADEAQDDPKTRVARDQPASHASTDGPGWLLSGTNGQGGKIALRVDAAQLARSRKGLVIGRQASAVDLLIDDPSVSRRHARLHPHAVGVGIVDLESSNGTRVGGRPLKPYDAPVGVAPGETLILGDVTLTLANT